MGMNLRFLGLVFAAVVLAALPARAQDGAIKIINDDGSVTEFKIPKNESAMRVVPPPPELEPEPAMESEMEEFAPASPPPAPREKDKPLERRDFLGRVLKYEGKKAASAPAAAAPVTEVVKEMPKETVAAAKGGSAMLPVPARKPERAAAASDPAGVSSVSAPGAVISQNEAVGIAISHAPPARDFKVFRAMHDNSPVYAIVFKTDKGDFEVLVDAYTGNVVKK